MATEVSGLMFNDHKEIFDLLKKFEKNGGEDAEKNALLFDKFKWRLEVHILIEERVIFSEASFSEKNGEMVQQLLSEHHLLLDMLRSLERRLASGYTEFVVRDLKEVLESHRDFEEKKLYPKLDKELKEKTKKFMVEQLKTRLYT